MIIKMGIGRLGLSGYDQVGEQEILSLLTGGLPRYKGKGNWRLQVTKIR